MKTVWEANSLDMPLGEFVQKLRDIQHGLLANENSRARVRVYLEGFSGDERPVIAVELLPQPRTSP